MTYDFYKGYLGGLAVGFLLCLGLTILAIFSWRYNYNNDVTRKQICDSYHGQYFEDSNMCQVPVDPITREILF